MKKLKNIFTFIICLVVILSCCFVANAATPPRITLSNATAAAGETAKIDISIANNPGIHSMTFSITYNSNSLEHISNTNGFIPNSYTIKDHPDKGHLIFVYSGSKDVATNGVILSLEFKVKDNAPGGKHTISLANQDRKKYGNKLHNSFCNSNLDYIIPTVSSGSITVPETCENSGHKFGEWTITSPADCTNTGSKTRACTRCEFSETAEIPITHDFEDEWTVDKVATPEEDGTMSRHCTKCDAVTDEITFTYKDVEDSQNPEDTPSTENSSSEDSSSEEKDSSTDETSSESSSDTQNSSATTSSNTSSNSSSKPSSTPNKTPINNTVGSKNPLSAIENIKDYQENVKPNTDKTSSEVGLDNNNKPESTPDESTPDESNSNTTTGTIGSLPNDQTDDDSNVSTGLDTTSIIIYVVSAIISIAIIVLLVLIIIRRKNK